MLELTPLPTAAPAPSPAGPPAPAQADGSAGFADLLGSQLAPTPEAKAGSTDSMEASDAGESPEQDVDHTAQAVAGIWQAQDWVQRLGEPHLAGARETGGEPHGIEALQATDTPQLQSRAGRPVQRTGDVEPARADMDTASQAPLPADDVDANAGAADIDPFTSVSLSDETRHGSTDTVQAPRAGDAVVAPLATAAAASTPGASAAGPTPAVHISTPVGDAQFPAALAAQVSVLARDGMHEARLHLHPAEMGPVAVQIVMEGTRAHVQFVAAVDSTCQLLQDSLGQLDTALSEAGLSLAGSSVSQQQAGSGQEQAGGHAPTHNDGTAANGMEGQPHARALAPRSLVDLVV